jgi:CRISPR-associated endonuclease Csn1
MLNNKGYKITKADRITECENMELFDIICDKCCSKPFSVIYGKFGILFKNNRDNFEKISLTEQTKTLKEMIDLLKTNRSNGVNLLNVGGSGKSAKKKLNMKLFSINDFSDIRIIDQSPTGLLEKKSPNLLEL